MSKDDLTVRVLFVSDNQADVDKMKETLDQTMRLKWDMTHCVNVQETLSRINQADVIILDLSLKGFSSPEDIFSDIQDTAFETPIIVLTGQETGEHELATYVMEKGAADSIVRGRFSQLVDAIEFALIRQKISTDKRKNSERALEQGATDLQTSESGRTADREKSRKILSMFSGGYSVDKDD